VINLERNVQGVQHLPQGYTLAILPTFAKVMSTFPDTEEAVTVSSTWNAAKILITIIQTFYASFTLYEATKGQQTDQYGYAGFGFTVIPYVVMSIVNLFGSLVTPDYPAMFLVWSAELKEAQDRGGKFDVIVGTVVPNVADEVDNGTPEARIAVFSRQRGLEQEVEGTVYCNVREPASILITQPSATNQKEPTTEEVLALTEFEQVDMNIGEEVDHGTASNISQISTFVVELGNTCRLRRRVGIRRQKLQNYEAGFGSSMRRAIIEDDKMEAIFDKKLPRDVIAVPSCTPFEVIPKGQWNNKIFGMLYAISVWSMCGIPFAVIGSLTHFKQGHSTVVQRVFTMGWLAVDILLGNFSVGGKRFASGLHSSYDTERKFQTSDWEHFGIAICWVLPVAVGGFSVVGVMIRDYDFCSAV
jgi:hypothetical protein